MAARSNRGLAEARARAQAIARAGPSNAAKKPPRGRGQAAAAEPGDLLLDVRLERRGSPSAPGTCVRDPRAQHRREDAILRLLLRGEVRNVAISIEIDDPDRRQTAGGRRRAVRRSCAPGIRLAT